MVRKYEMNNNISDQELDERGAGRAVDDVLVTEFAGNH